MSVEMNEGPAQPEGSERREALGDRIPFEGIVEVGGALGPSFEAQAVDVSEGGMHLRTAYLPELGQPLTCRLEVGNEVVLAAGEVVWRQEADRGGEFGLRFTEIDPASEAALKKLVTVEPTFAEGGPGARVRLHIEGLGSPMRARIKGSLAEGMVVGSELGFLKVGKELELEDAVTGGKRAARIHRVAVEVNPETQVPQLVVSLRYEVSDTDVSSAAAPPRAGPDDTPEPSVIDDDKPRPVRQGTIPGIAAASVRRATLALDEGEDDPFGPMRSGVGEAFHRASARVGPALERLGAQAKTAFGIVAARAKKAASKSEEAAVPRRTTAPAPAGGLHAKGRKVVRAEPISAMAALEEAPSPLTKRRIALGSAALVAGVIVLAAVHKPGTSFSVATTTDPAQSSTVTVLGNSSPASPPTALAPVSSAAPLSAPLAPMPPEEAPSTLAHPTTEDSHGHKKPLHVTPFGNGPVAHANILRLKMDGVIEKIEGATTPTGFNVVIPDRRSLEAAAPLATKDGRIAAIRVTNEANGAELAVSFKDGVPSYQVRARGDSLEILLAPQGKVTDVEDAPKTPKRSHLKH